MKGIYLILLVLFAMCCYSHTLSAQATPDTIVIDSTVSDTVVSKEKKGSIFSGRPGKSMIMSLIIPGAGQIYNKSYLRVPFVWGAVGGMGYLVYSNTLAYQCRKTAYEASIDG